MKYHYQLSTGLVFSCKEALSFDEGGRSHPAEGTLSIIGVKEEYLGTLFTVRNVKEFKTDSIQIICSWETLNP